MRKTLSLALGLSLALTPALAQAAPTVAAIKAVKTNIGGAAAAGRAGLASFRISGPLNRSFSPSLAGGLKTGTVHTLKLDSNAAATATEAAASSIISPIFAKTAQLDDSILSIEAANETVPAAKSETRSVFSRAAAFAAKLGRSIKTGKSGKAAAASNRIFDNGSLRRGETESKVQGRFAALGRSNSEFGLKSTDELPEAANDAAFDAEETAPENKGPPTPAPTLNTSNRSGAAPVQVRSIETGAEDDAQPAKKKSVWRSVKLGWMTAIGMLFLYTAVDLVAGLVGYTFTANYTMPEVANPAWWSQIIDTFMAAVMAPLNEEVYFRAGIMGGLALLYTGPVRFILWLASKISKKAEKLKKHAPTIVFVIAALFSSIFFVVIHETGDPILIATRMFQAVMMSYLFAKEGILSSIFHHGFFNLLAGLLFFSLITVPGGYMVAVVPAAILFLAFGTVFYLSKRKLGPSLKREKAEIKAGTRVAYRLTARSSAVLALISFATAALVIPLGMSIESLLLVGMGIQMLPAALALGIYAQYLRQYRKAKGTEAVKKFTEPEGKYAMFNKLGGLTAAKIYLGMIAIALGFNLALGAYPAFAMTPVLVLGAIALTLTIVGFFAKKFWKKSLIGMLSSMSWMAALGTALAPVVMPILIELTENAGLM